jgi:hypothetical protein
LNLDEQGVLDAGDSWSLGKAYVPGPHTGDIIFEYITPDLEVISSFVHYTGATNDLAIYVDPATGEASMANLSEFIDTPSIKGYSILSASGGLTENAWTSLASTGSGGEGWTEANPAANHISELNLDNFTAFENPTAISLGAILAPGSDTRDLVFEYITVEGEVRNGTVQYTRLPVDGIPGDCNNDGVVDEADLACVSTTEERDIVLATIPSLPGDLDGNGQVDFSDFLVVSTNFNMDLPGYQDGNIDLAGGIEFADFLILSTNFNKVPAAAAAAVPEPSAALLGLLGTLLGFRARRPRRVV